MEGALRQGDLPRLVELGLLHDYGSEACAYHHGIRAQLLYAQLKLEDDPYLRAWLLADMDDVTDGELVLIAEHALTQEDVEIFNRCGDTVAARLRHDRQHLADGSYPPSWRQRHMPQLALAAMSDDVQLVHCVLDFAAANRERGFHRKSCRCTATIYARSATSITCARCLPSLLRMSQQRRHNTREQRSRSKRGPNIFSPRNPR
jgi:hypothetical protein